MLNFPPSGISNPFLYHLTMGCGFPSNSALNEIDPPNDPSESEIFLINSGLFPS